MDKNAIKKYAVWARRELIARVSQKALQYGITAEDCGDANAESMNGEILTKAEKKQRQALIAEIKEKGFEQVMEEVAYTWFNRFSALRFMEVNGYLPSHVRVFTDEDNNFKPQIITEAIHLEMDGLDMEKVYALKDVNKTDELYKYLLITQCNALSSILPGMFQRIEDFSELLFPDNLLREGSAIQQMIELIPEEDWKDAVQIIGWLYQYYNSEKKDDVFAALKKNVKITKDNIPAATQLFTPDWIVRYMVENSLGRLWIEGHPNDTLKSEWKYYLDEAEQEPDVQKRLAEIRKEYAGLKPEDIKCIDPCMGSGHILAYMFDVLMQIYEAYGYSSREAVESIVKNNLYGLDIDDRAAQLANFAVMMKARQYDRRFFSRGMQPHVHAIVESNQIQYDKEMGDFLLSEEHRVTLRYLLDVFQDAKEYGSILNVEQHDYDGFLQAWQSLAEGSLENIMMIGWYMAANEKVQALAKQAILLSQKYGVVVTNPPYMGSSGMGNKLSEFVKSNYPDTKSDMSTVCMEKTIAMCNQNGYIAMINIPVWMFLSSYEKLRANILHKNRYVNMLHLGRGVFGSDFGTTAFVIAKSNIHSYRSSYRRLFEKQGAVDSLEVKEQWFFDGKGCYTAEQDNFEIIPGAPIAYWLSPRLLSAFQHTSINSLGCTKQGLATGNNDLFLKLWFEPSMTDISFTSFSRTQAIQSKCKWFPCNKGGAYQKWYGNNDYVVNWWNDGFEIRNFKDEKGKLRSRPQNMDYYFREGITWSTLSIGQLSMRYSPAGHLFETKGSCCFVNSPENLYYVLGIVNSKVVYELLQVLCPTVDFHEGPIGKIPVIIDEVQLGNVMGIVKSNVDIVKSDVDSFENSWDFKMHPFAWWAKGLWDCTAIAATMSKFHGEQKPKEVSSPLELCFLLWQGECNERFNQLKDNEEELNRIFIDIYGLQDELTQEVEDKDVTVRKADLQRDIKSFISYAVGCMFGRYSLDVEGLAYAGGEWDASKYRSFPADKDNIIPICDDEYFEDDIVGRFIEFVKAVYGEDSLEANLQFIADALGGKGSAREVIRSYFRNDFYADHCNTYSVTGSGKRPIYWLFDSGKKGGFKALIYMHRYQQDTIARMRTDYVHEQQARYRTEISDLETRIAGASTGERVKLNKRLVTLQAQADEIHGYEEKIHHLADQMIRIDLDDGVKKNYEIFQDVLAKIK